jgi:Rps23 Pro-64 3,4-dihydroxylase Tpa1-like proline 4-hydroxylase
MTQTSSTPQAIDVTVLLTGGHQFTVSMPADAPLLRKLFEVVLDQNGDRRREAFQLPIQKGRSALCFRGDQLVGLITDPPLVIQAPTEAPSPIEAAMPTSMPNRNLVTSEYIQIDDFLIPSEHQALIDYVLQRESDFVPTTTSTGAADYRKSVVLHFFPEFSELIMQQIRTALPDVLSQLRLPLFTASQIESQLTAHNDGNYYKVHNDNGSPETATRMLTYVYYFYREPKAFSGGELLLYDSTIENNYYVQAESFQTVEPRNNSIVFFPSHYMHEVLTVVCPSRAFVDSRFTVNGWVRR